MKRCDFVVHILVAIAVIASASQAFPGTFTHLNSGDPHTSWSMPRINSAGNVALIRATSSAYGGNPYLWTGSWATLTAFTGSAVYVDNAFQPKMELNDNDRIAFQSSGTHAVAVAETSGIIPMGAAPNTLNYAIDINDSNRVAAYSYIAWLNNHIYTSDDPYTVYDDDVGPADIIQFRIAYNNNNQIAWKPPGTSTIYRFTPGVGNEAIGSSNWAPFDIDDRGRIIHVRDQDKIMLNNMVLRHSSDVWPASFGYSQPRISDNGRYVTWTEHDGTRSDLWSMVDGIPTNITHGSYQDVLCPDVNNNGLMVFMSATGFGTYPYTSDVYLYVPDDPEPIVYNGHFDGETFFGWDVVLSGAADATLETAGAGFAAQLTSGSPAALEQAVDLPSGSATLSFDFDFATANGTLTVTLGGVPMAQLTSADDTEPGFTSLDVEITATPPLGEDGVTLSFSLDDAAVSTAQIDNIEISSGSSGVTRDHSGKAGTLECRAYPNPFSESTTLYYGGSQVGLVEVAIYDAGGRLVKSLSATQQEQGPGSLHWDGTSDTGEILPAGVYFMRVSDGRESASRKLMIVR